MTAYFYILSCSDGTFYTEVTHDLVNRVGEHIEGLNPSAYTYSRRPVKLVHYETFDTIEQALKRRSELARTTRWKKSEMLKIGLGK
ncbi:MAG: GIY-YIG nuclease family protein [Bacteroidales bacterium]